MIEPCGYRILVKPVAVEEITQGGIILAREAKLAEEQAIDKGTVVKIGPSAFHDDKVAGTQLHQGDTVVYAKYAGKRIKDKDGVDYLIINDEDIVAILKD